MKRSLLLNLLLALVWGAVTGRFDEVNLLFGFAIGYLVMRAVQPLTGSASYIQRVWSVIDLAVFFVRELVVASLRVAADILTPRHRMRPGIIALPLEVESAGTITLLANLISLTPGTLSLDLSEDRRTLFVHVMYVAGHDVAATQQMLKQTLERRVRKALETS